SAAAAQAQRSVADDTWLRFRGFGIWSQTDGEIDFHNDTGVAGIRDNIDFHDTLGMDMKKFNGGALVGFNLGSEHRFHIDLSYWGYYDYTGERTLGSINFNGTVFTGRVASKLQLDEVDVDMRYDLWKPDTADLTLSLLLAA